jgi:TRAP-type C4-dicarboxylate transport system substrate-binding protein
VSGSAIALTMLAPAITHASDESYRLVLTSEAGDRDSALGQAMQTWARLIEEKSADRIDVEVFYQGELGGQQELFDQLVKGNVHLMITWSQTSYDPRIAVNYVPYMVMGWEDAVVSFGDDGWVRKVMDPVHADIGMKYFGPFPEGFGGIATKNRHATSYEEAQGIKVRSQPIFPLPQTVQAMGFEGRADRLGGGLHLAPDRCRRWRFLQRDLLGLRVFPRPA